MTQLTIGELLRRHRLDASLTQKEVADMIGCHNSVVSRVEQGRQQPTPDYVERFIEELYLPELDKQEIMALYRQSSQVEAIPPPSQLPDTRSREDWGEALDVVLRGRRTELVELQQWIITDRYRLVAVLGLGGIGKTALATALARQIKDEFEYVIWRSLRNAPPLEDILADCIKFFSNQQQTDLSEDVSRRITLLIDYLRQHRCLMILDNAETILRSDRAGYYLDGYEGYGELIQRVGETDHQSCLLLTSRERPKELNLIESKTTPVRSLQLTGLEQVEGREILTDMGLSAPEETLNDLIDRYIGSPLALKLVSSTIQTLYSGDITAFLKDAATTIGYVRDPLEQQFERLSEREREIMYWLAINREPVSLPELREDIVRLVSPQELLEALEALQRRSMIETSSGRFTLHPVVMEYITDQLIKRLCKEITAGVIELFQSHTLIKAQAKDYVRESQTQLILKPVVDRLLTALDKEGVEDKLRRILSNVRHARPQKPSYAPGNVLNLLVQLGSNLSSYDFSNLTAWQVYLRGIELHDVNFAYADLDRSVFTETFGGIISVSFSPDGTLLAAGTANGEIRVWRIINGQPLLTCRGHTDLVRSVAFSPNGQSLVSGSNDQTVRLWNVDTGQCLKVLQGHTGRVRSVAFNTDGDRLVSSSSDRTVRLWDVNTGQCLKTLRGHTRSVRAVAFSLDGRMLASGSFDQTVRLWDVSTGQCLKILQGHTDRVWSVAFNTDGDSLVSSSSDRTVRLWDVNTGQCLGTLRGHTRSVRAVAFSPTGKMLASGGTDRTVRLWDVNTGQCLKTLQGHTDRVWSVVFDPDGDTVASGSRDQTVRLWNVNTGKPLQTLQGHTNPALSVAFDFDGRTLASSHDDLSVRLWDVCTGQCLKRLWGHTKPVWSITFSFEDDLLASCSRDHTVRLWDVRTGQCLAILHDHAWPVSTIAFSPDGNILASGSDDWTVKLWDVSMYQCIKTLQGHTERVRSVTFSPDGRLLASGSFDQTVRLWDVNTHKCLKVLRGHTNQVTSVAFNPHCDTLVCET